MTSIHPPCLCLSVCKSCPSALSIDCLFVSVDSENVQVDSTGEKVRPTSQRSTLILREIPQATPLEAIHTSQLEATESYSIVFTFLGSKRFVLW